MCFYPMVSAVEPALHCSRFGIWIDHNEGRTDPCSTAVGYENKASTAKV